MGEGGSLGALLVELRLHAGMSQEQLGAAAGMSAKTISDIETGTTQAPRAATIERIMTALGLDVATRQRVLSLRPSRGSSPAGMGRDAVPRAGSDGDFVAATLGQAVTYLRTRLKLTGPELGHRSGLSARTIADIEAGRRKRVHPANAISLADVLELTGEPRKRFLDLASGTVVPDAVQLGAIAPADMAGREQELAAVLALLTDKRIVSLTGPGGIGKTTLAEAVLANLKRPCVSMFLADVPIGEDLARAIALIGRFDEEAGDEWVSQFGPLLPYGAVLLLDNLEHLLRVPTVINEISASRPDIALLTTSRTSIELADAHELEIRPLRPAAAVRAFRTAAAAAGRPVPAPVQSDVIEQICARLDGLPLAIVLAAGWTRLMTPRDILTRLDRPEEILRSPGAWPDQADTAASARHVAIDRTVRWSLALVTDSARMLFRGLAAYPAPWPLDLIEAIHPAPDVLRALDELLQARLVAMTASAAGGTTYIMLQTIRDVGRSELMADRGLAEEILERHAAHLLKRAQEIGPMFTTMDRVAALEAGDQLALHMEGALRRLIDTGDGRAISLVAAWWRYWKDRGRYRSGMALCVEALGVLADPGETSRDVAESWYGAAALAYLAGHNDRAARYAADALGRFQRLGDSAGIGGLMSLIGMMELHSGHKETALEWYQRGLREIDDVAAPRAYATLLGNVAPVYAALGDLTAARAAAEAATARYQVLGDHGSAAAQLGNLGLWAARAGDRDRAAQLLHESRDLLHTSGDLTSLIEAHLDLAKLHVDEGDSAAALLELDAARQLGGLADDTWGDAMADALAAQIAVLSGDMPKARSLARVAMRKGETLAYQAPIVGGALAAAAAAAWSSDLDGTLAAAAAGLKQSEQADEAAVISLALLVAAVLLDGVTPAAIGQDLLALEQSVRLWASVPSGRPYAIARLAARRRGFPLADSGRPGTLVPIGALCADALALCSPGASV